MNDLLLYDVGVQKHSETISRAEAKIARRVVATSRDRASVRHRIASVLVTLATQLQPGLRCEIPQPIRPTTA